MPISNRERRRRAEQSRRERAPGDSFSIPEWCKHRRISKAMFYLLAERGMAPRTHNVGARRLISEEADAEWLREREEAASVAAE